MIETSLSAALAFIMFSLGLSLKPSDFSRAMSSPKELLAGAVTQIVLLPIIAFTLVVLFDIQGQLAIGVMILSCCPGGITSNIMTKLAKGDVALSISYTALASIATAVSLPLILRLSSYLLSPLGVVSVSILPLSLRIFLLATLPVFTGVVTGQLLGFKAQKVEKVLGRLANILFAVIVLGVLVSQWSAFASNLPTLGPALLGLNLIMLTLGLAVGSSLGMNTQKSTALAIEAGFQNGTIGIVVGTIVGASDSTIALNSYSLPSAVYGVLMLITIAPFIAWRRKAAMHARTI